MRVTLRPSRLIIRSGPSGPAGSGGAGTVDSVNGQTGVVVLDAADVGADAAGTAAGLIAALGDSASLDVGTTTGTVAAGDDARFTDPRTPTAHASTHATVGSDPLSPGAIGAVPVGAWASTGITSTGTTVSEAISLSGWQVGGLPRPVVGTDVRQALMWETSGTPRWVARALTASDVGGVVLSSEVSETPGASLIPRADTGGKLDDWITVGSAGGVQAWSATLDAYAGGDLPSVFTLGIVDSADGPAWLTAIGAIPLADATATPTASKIPIADGAGKLAAGWLPAATTTTPGAVELATDLEATSSAVPTGADTRLGWAFRSLHLAVGY